MRLRGQRTAPQGCGLRADSVETSSSFGGESPTRPRAAEGSQAGEGSRSGGRPPGARRPSPWGSRCGREPPRALRRGWGSFKVQLRRGFRRRPWKAPSWCDERERCPRCSPGGRQRPSRLSGSSEHTMQRQTRHGRQGMAEPILGAKRLPRTSQGWNRGRVKLWETENPPEVKTDLGWGRAWA